MARNKTEMIDEAISILVEECQCPLETYQDKWETTEYGKQPAWCVGQVDEHDNVVCKNGCGTRPWDCWRWFLENRKRTPSD